MERRLYNWMTRRSTVIRRLEIAVAQAESDLAVEKMVTKSLQEALKVAMDPYNTQAQRVEECMAAAATDAYGQIVQAPDGEFIAPAAFDWERLAHDILDNETGGASGSWE